MERRTDLAVEERGLPGAFTVLPGRFESAPEGWRYLFSWQRG